jgi:hypothetical protein
MEYVIEAGRRFTSDQLIALHKTIGGENEVVSTLKGAGYEYWHLEGGWSGSRCGEHVDHCIPAPLLDDGIWGLLERTPMSSLLSRVYGHPYTVAAPSRLEALDELAKAEPSYARRPRFVFAHVLLPHPPLLLNADCAFRPDAGLGGTMIGGPENLWNLDRRKDAYVDQVRCANRQILNFVQQAPADSIVILTADHGPDSYGQLATIPLEGWSSVAIWERMSIFSAIRLPDSCRTSLPDHAAPVNYFRITLSCLGYEGLEPLPIKSILIPPVTERFDTLQVTVPASGKP